MRTFAAKILLALAVLGVLTGCSASDSLGSRVTPTAGSGTLTDTVTEIPPAERGDPIDFTGTLDVGGTADSTDWLGSVVVVNFWYAGCPPCRAEAPDLKALSEKYAAQGVVFIGINVRDQADTALAFADTFDIPYPSILDTDTAQVQLAFAGEIAPNAVPTTLVLDTEGRVASRIIGRIPDRSILDTLISDTLAETP